MKLAILIGIDAGWSGIKDIKISVRDLDKVLSRL
jgi:hypothetical protein